MEWMVNEMKYFINGWREGRSYFLSFRFTQEEIDRMVNGETIVRGTNEFSIEVEQ